MNDFTSKSSSSLVVAEKNVRRPGGCAGIFFKLFDWNRRFAKKKLFPKKLLAPARGNQVMKKFNADENLPKAGHLLTTDVNGGGIKKNDNLCSLHSELKKEMGSPSLVARLMGLESIPVVEFHSPGKSPLCRNHYTENARFVEGSEKEVLSLEKSSPRHGIQPQKIQKTGLSERRAVNKFGADALQIRSVLSRSRKRHQKLASPVKCPRTAKSTSRLIDAATRILEPGLQATSRAKCAFTYSNSMVQPIKDEAMREAVITLPAQSSCKVVNPQGLKTQATCQNCGHAVEAMYLTNDVFEQSPTLDMPTSNAHNAFFDVIQENKPRLPRNCEKESEVILLRSRYQPEALQAQGNVISGARQHPTILNGMCFSPSGQNHWDLPKNSIIHDQGDTLRSVSLKDRVQAHSCPQMLIREDRVPPKYSFSNMHDRKVPFKNAFNDKTDFITQNQNVSQPCVRSPRKPYNYDKVCKQYQVPRDVVFSTQENFVRKRGSAAVCRHVESSSSSSSITARERNLNSIAMTESRPSFRSKSTYPTRVKSRPVVQGGNLASRSKDIDVVSFSFSSALNSKPRGFCPTKMDDVGMDQSNFFNGDISWQRVNKGNHGEKSLSSLLMNRDNLRALLEQKLKELTCQADYESATSTQGRTTASILQELLSALTAERPISPDLKNILSSDAALTDGSSQADAGAKGLSARFCGDRFSPGSVLDATFSNDSYVSSSIDDNSGHMLQSGFMDFSSDVPQLVHSDVELSDSASSMNNRETSNKVPVSHLLYHISRVLDRTNIPDVKLSTAYSSYTKEVLLNTELLFGEADHSEMFVDFLMGPFLSELETLSVVAWRSTVVYGFQVSNGANENPLRRFLFDCLVECLSVRYDRYINCGFRTWCGLTRQMNMEALIQVFDYEVRKWASMAEMTPFEIIDWEMSTWCKWTDIEIEAFETGGEIGQIIFQGLVDEILADILWS